MLILSHLLDIYSWFDHLVWVSKLSKTFIFHILHTQWSVSKFRIFPKFFISTAEKCIGPQRLQISIIHSLLVDYNPFLFQLHMQSKNRSPSYKISHNSVHSRPIWLKLSGVTPETCFTMTQYWYLHVLQDPISMTWRMGGFLIWSKKNLPQKVLISIAYIQICTNFFFFSKICANF